jgi:hypothetical protein
VRETIRLSPEEIRAYIHTHFERNPNCDFEHVATGWRVKFGRPMDSREAVLAREIYEEEDELREQLREAEWAAAEARRPKGPINRFLAMRWQGQMILGLLVFLVAIYGGAMAFYTPTQQDLSARPVLPPASGPLGSFFANPGVERASSFLFWAVLVTGGVGAVVILFISWALGYAIVRGLRSVIPRPRAAATE